MSDAWSAGYVSDVVYTQGFHRELAPTLLDYVCLANGVEGLPAGRRLRYCELGCGRGYGTVLLAAANPDIDFVGIDFNPSHIAEAREHAEEAKADNIIFEEMEFAEAARSPAAHLAKFDIVALHGVYAWVAPEVRESIHAFIRDKLNSGGIAFVSYNTLPGWTPLIPIQKLLFEAAARTTGNSVERISRSLELLQTLAGNEAVAKHRLLPQKMIAQLAGKDRHYLAHEFLTGAWRPLFVTEAFSLLAEAKLSFVGSAVLCEGRLELSVPKELLATVQSASDLSMRELLKDFIRGQQFRRDVYVKGPRQLTPVQQVERLKALSFSRLPYNLQIPERLRTPRGEVAPRRDVLEAIWRRAEGAPVSGAEILKCAVDRGEKVERVWPLLDILIDNGILHPARRSAGGDDVVVCPAFNRSILAASLGEDVQRHLASPVLGSAFHATQPERVAALVLSEQPDLPDDMVALQAFDRAYSAGGKFVKSDGETIQKSDENLRKLATFVAQFRQHRLPMWRALGVVA